jgi:hypothetical protein
MRTLKEARAFHTSSNQSDTQSYFKHLGDMNYQIMIVLPFSTWLIAESEIVSFRNGSPKNVL